MDKSEHSSVEGDQSQRKAERDELVVKAARFLRNAKPKLNRFIVFARPRAQEAGQEALRYVREHEGEIKQTAATLARYRFGGPLGLVVDALTRDSSPDVEKDLTKCPSCGTVNTQVAKFCTECGLRLTQETTQDD